MLMQLARPVPTLPPTARAPQTSASVNEGRVSIETPRETSLPLRGAPPPVPGDNARSPVTNRSSYFGSEASPISAPGSSDRRAGKIPPVPGAALGSPPLLNRPPPPAPPSAAPIEEPDEGESEYEGDYDTDIASDQKHKDALKSHVREPSLDDSVTADEVFLRSPRQGPVSPPTSHRPVPPPPPPTAQPTSRSSLDAPRAPPPIPPRDMPLAQEGGDDGFHTYQRYQNLMRDAPPAPTAPSAPPPVIQAPAPQDESSDDLYEAEPSRKSVERGPPPPSSEPVPRVSESVRPTRQSLDVSQAINRRSTDAPRPSQGYIATDINLTEGGQWWAKPDQPPPVFHTRTDILCEVEESSTSKRGGKTTISKDVYVLFLDYSQTVITAQFDARNPSDVALEQRHEPPPARLRQDQLEKYWQTYGARIAEAASALGGKKDPIVGDGSAGILVLDLIKTCKNALLPVGTRAYGALVYANMANASVQQFDEIRPGDVITLRNAKLQGKHGGLHQKYSMDVQGHVAVVVEWDGTKKKIRALEQGREKGKVRVESFRLGDLKSGEVRVWRVVGRDWVGWDSDNA